MMIYNYFVFIILCRESDEDWPEPDKGGKQELELIHNGQHIFFQVSNCSPAISYLFLLS